MRLRVFFFTATRRGWAIRWLEGTLLRGNGFRVTRGAASLARTFEWLSSRLTSGRRGTVLATAGARRPLVSMLKRDRCKEGHMRLRGRHHACWAQVFGRSAVIHLRAAETGNAYCRAEPGSDGSMAASTITMDSAHAWGIAAPPNRPWWVRRQRTNVAGNSMSKTGKPRDADVQLAGSSKTEWCSRRRRLRRDDGRGIGFGRDSSLQRKTAQARDGFRG